MAFALYSIKYIAPYTEEVLNIFKDWIIISYYYRIVTGSTPAQERKCHGERPLYGLFTSVHFLGKKSEQTKTYHYNWYSLGRRTGTDGKAE